MKALKLFTTVIVSLTLFASSWASASTSGLETTLAEKIQNLAAQCVVQPYSINAKGIRTNLTTYSECLELQKINETTARVLIEGQIYTVIMADSENSDGGDLVDLTFTNEEQGVISTYTGILGFEDILLSMAGGSFAHLKEIEVQ